MIGKTTQLSHSEVVILLNLQNPGEKDMFSKMVGEYRSCCKLIMMHARHCTIRTEFTACFEGDLETNQNCYGRPLLHTWLYPDINTIPNTCIRENSLQLSGYGTGFLSRHSRFKPCPDLEFLLFICFFVTDIVCRMGARPELAIEPLIPIVVQKQTFCLKRLQVIKC